MLYLTHLPGPPLDQFIDLLWLYEGYTQSHAKERVLPTGEMQIVINLTDDQACIYDREDTDRCQVFRGPLLTGAHSQYQVISIAPEALMIGVHFRPGGAFPFLRRPAAELSETTVLLETLWGGLAIDLHDQLLEATTHRARFEILERVLREELAKSVDRHRAVGFALRRFMAAPHVTTMASVTEQIGLSPKRFIQIFRDETGFTPKVFCRIRRFQQALDRMGASKNVEWTKVALESGYFDQAHFNHDFRAFSGIKPTSYMVNRTPHRNHVALVALED